MSTSHALPDPKETLEVDVDYVDQALSRKNQKEGLDSDLPIPFTLIDCREQDEFLICRIEGAQLLPLSRFSQLQPEALGDPERPIVVYCHHGMRSAQAAQFLRHNGFPLAFSMAGGIDLWSSQIDPKVPRY